MADRYVEIHNSPTGFGDARPTALQIIQDEDLIGKLSGSVILVTGCSSGIGLATSKALYQTGATLYLTARDLTKAKWALGEEIVSSSRVHLLELDLGSLSSVRKCAQEFLSQEKTLNILIASAGVMGDPEGRTEDGFETQLGTNHLSHFLLFNLLKPTLLAAGKSRVVFVSSTSHRSSPYPDFSNLNLEGNYNPWIAYGQSKLFNTWTANEIDRRYQAQGIRAFSLQPGLVVDSNLGKHMSEEIKQGMLANEDLRKIFKNSEQGAATSVWAALAAGLEGKGGLYLEDCQIAGKWGEWKGSDEIAGGYGELAYNEEGEKKLWEVSSQLVDIKDNAL